MSVSSIGVALEIPPFFGLDSNFFRTVSGRQFDWGGRLLKGNGGAQRFPQAGWKSVIECKSRRELDCETYKSNRDESRF